MTKANSVIEKMQKCLDLLGINLTVVWTPDQTKTVHGEIKGSILLIYDSQEDEAWRTLSHEIIEYKLKAVTQVYRTLVNQLIEGYEKLVYRHKEEFIEFLPHLFETVQETKKGDLKK